ncbi:MAG: hypothetical protein LBT47_01905 [Deltaproteobacteria bacterium]|nr:hypothetical protein [Deltaproteobacteria bacterium]
MPSQFPKDSQTNRSRGRRPVQAESPAPAEGAAFDLQGLFALAREIGKALASFKAPPGFVAQSAPLEPVLTQDMVRALGAETLSDYFLKTPLPEGESRPESPPALQTLPGGTDELYDALTAVTRRLTQIQRAEARSGAFDDTEKADLQTNKVALSRAQKLFPRFKEIVDEWPRALRNLHREAKDLSDAVARLLKSPSDPALGSDGADTVALTAMVADLRGRLSEYKRVLARRLTWSVGLRNFRDELDSLHSAASLEEDHQAWGPQIARLTARFDRFEKEHQELSEAAADTVRRVAKDLEKLEKAESELSGDYEAARRHKGEVLVGQVRFLLRSALNRRRELAETYFFLPSLVGRPAFLEKAFLISAMSLGRVQTMAEEMNISLGRFNGRRSSTCDIRAAARQVAGVRERSREYLANLDRTRKWLSALSSLAQKRTQARESAVSPPKARPARVAVPFMPPSGDLLERQLRAMESESRNLDDSLIEARSELAATGRIKVEVLKTFNRVKQDMAHLRADRQNLDDELKKVAADMASLKRRHLRLTEYFTRDHRKLKETEEKYQALTEARRVDRQRACEHLEEKAKLTASVKQHREDINKLTQDRQTLLASQARINTELDELRARESGLTVELSGLEEELKEANQVRARLGQVIVSYRSQLDRLTVANNYLKAAWARRGRLLSAGETERDQLRDSLGRHKRDLVTAVTKRQELMAELGQQNLRLDKLAEERTVLLTELDRLRREAGARAETAGQLEREREGLYQELERIKSEATFSAGEAQRLGEELEGRQREIDEDLKPFVQLLAITLWRSQSYLKVVVRQAETKVKEEQQQSKAREADLRISAATKEIDYLELLETREKELEELQGEREGLKADLEAAKNSNAHYLEELQGERDGLKADLEAAKNTNAQYLEELQGECDGLKADLEAAKNTNAHYLEELQGERDGLKADLEAANNINFQNGGELTKRSWLCHQLSVALSATNLRRERLRQRLRDFQVRLQNQKEESGKIKSELEALIKNQNQALVAHQAWLAALMPMVGHFLNVGSDFWAGPGREDARDAVLFFMTRENAELSVELGEIKAERQTLYAERRNLTEVFESMRSRLDELKPLVEFLVVKFAQVSSQLAEVLGERDRLKQEIEVLTGAMGGLLPPPDEVQAQEVAGEVMVKAELLSDGNEFEEVNNELTQARFQVAKLATENRSLIETINQSRENLERQRAGLRLLEGQNKELAASLEDRDRLLASATQNCTNLENDRQRLLASMERQGMDLTLARSEAGRLAIERDQLKIEAQKRADELGVLQARLYEINNAKPQADGRLESAWAAMTYLSAKAGDAMGSLQQKLDRQARELESSTIDLRNKEAEIKRLENRQDSLSLMFWTMLSLAAESAAGGPDLDDGSEDGQGASNAAPSAVQSADGLTDEEILNPPRVTLATEDLGLGDFSLTDLDVDSLSEPRQPDDSGAVAEKSASAGAGAGQPASAGALPGAVNLEASTNQRALEALDGHNGPGTQDLSGNQEHHGTQQDLASADEASSQKAPKPPYGGVSPDIAAGSPAGISGQPDLAGEVPSADSGLPQTQGDGKTGQLGGSFLSDLRKAARRGLFSLFLTGGLIFLLPDSVGAGSRKSDTLELGTPETPMVFGQPPVSRAHLFTREPVFAPDQMSRWGSSYLGRTLDLNSSNLPDLPAGVMSRPAAWLADSGRFSPASGDPGAFRPYVLISEMASTRKSQAAVTQLEQWGGLPVSSPPTPQVSSGDTDFGRSEISRLNPSSPVSFNLEEMIRLKVTEQAVRWGQEPEDWLRLIRRAYGPEATISLADLDAPAAPIQLLSPHLPLFAEALNRCGLTAELAPSILTAASCFDFEEGAYWDRLYMCLRAKTASEREAVEGFKGRLERKPSLRVPFAAEYIGPFKPVAAFEGLELDRATELLTEQIKSEWPGTGRLKKPIPKGREALRMAQDLIYSAKIFGLPRTLFVASSHADYFALGAWPDTLAVYRRGIFWVDQICLNLKVSYDDMPYMCDIDSMTARLFRDSHSGAVIPQKYMAFLEFLNRKLSPATTIFSFGRPRA